MRIVSYRMTLLVCAAALLAVAGTAKSDVGAAQPGPVLTAQIPQPNQIMLPANTEITLRMNNEITSKRNREGETFSLSVVQDVYLGHYLIIPRGARGIGEITWMTHKGAFGKSGKMDIALKHIDVGGFRIPIEGKFRQEGEGNTVATVGAVIAVGIFSALVTGRTAVIPEGRELVAHTTQDMPVQIPATSMPMASAAPAPTASPVIARSPVAASSQAFAVAVSPSYGNGVALFPANTASGYCISAPPGYRGSGSKSAPAITSGMPRCKD